MEAVLRAPRVHRRDGDGSRDDAADRRRGIGALSAKKPGTNFLPPSISLSISLSRVLAEMDESGQVEEKVYVALPERFKDGKSTLSWVLNHFSKDVKIIITHVHIPAQMIPMMGTKFPANQLSPHQVNSYRQEEWEKAEKHLNDYLPHCSKAKETFVPNFKQPYQMPQNTGPNFMRRYANVKSLKWIWPP
ncbi:U-box domain-containing protein 33-like isoform X1 [Carex littledalei]|uniref:U-box domain-containing protein 33-like isoform X1 n=1 Tax=Carex littledalei TaxID=544730 RepID=A0A833QJP6_9POAL|nr:U-box domain-containing protein 33-like isoform X1 [Carex littledalei]